jgi:hypothetical protein
MIKPVPDSIAAPGAQLRLAETSEASRFATASSIWRRPFL